jgi:hypothetical protein
VVIQRLGGDHRAASWLQPNLAVMAKRTAGPIRVTLRYGDWRPPKARKQGVAGFRLRVRWLGRLRMLPWEAVRESGLVLRALLWHVSGRRAVRGRFRVVPVALPDDPDEQAAKRARLTAGESFAPNTYVLAIDNRKGVMLTHELVSEDDE